MDLQCAQSTVHSALCTTKAVGCNGSSAVRKPLKRVKPVKALLKGDGGEGRQEFASDSRIVEVPSHDDAIIRTPPFSIIFYNARIQ